MSRIVFVGDQACTVTFFDVIDLRPAPTVLHPIATALAGVVGFGVATVAARIVNPHGGSIVTAEGRSSGGPLGYLESDDYLDPAFQPHLIALFSSALHLRLHVPGAEPAAAPVIGSETVRIAIWLSPPTTTTDDPWATYVSPATPADPPKRRARSRK